MPGETLKNVNVDRQTETFKSQFFYSPSEP